MQRKTIIYIMLSFILGSALTAFSASTMPPVYHLINQIYVKISPTKYEPLLSYMNFTEDKIVFNKSIEFSHGIKGDCNGDGIVDDFDVSCIKAHITGFHICTMQTCDINGDGVINLADANLLEQYIYYALPPGTKIPYETASVLMRSNFKKIVTSNITVTDSLCFNGECKSSWSEVGGRTPCSKGVVILSQNQFQGNHNCDDNPSRCCPAGYHMCTESELNQYFAMGCIDFDAYDQWGWFNFTTYNDVTCNGWTTNSNSEYGADAKISLLRTYDRWNDLVGGPVYIYFGYFPRLIRGSRSCSISSSVNCNPDWRCKGGIDRTYYNRDLNSDCGYNSGYGITYTRGASCDTYRKVWCCPD